MGYSKFFKILYIEQLYLFKLRLFCRMGVISHPGDLLLNRSADGIMDGTRFIYRAPRERRLPCDVAL